MKSLNRIRAALAEAVAQDTEAHFVTPTDAQHSVGPLRRQDSDVDEAMDPANKRRNLAISMDYLRKKIRDERDFYKKDKYKDELRKFQDMYDKLDEALNLEKDPVDKWVADYTKSSDVRFKGMTKDARIKMALTDYHASRKAAGKNESSPVAESMDGGHEAEEISMTRLELDEIADMADDLFNVLPNFDEIPAWVQHKVAAMHAGLHSIYDYYRLKGIDRDQSCTSGLEVIQIATPENPVVQPAPVSPASMD